MRIPSKSLVVFLILNSIIIFNIVSSISAPNDFGYSVIPGDTLYIIAEKFEVDPDTLIQINKISNPSFIIPGQVITIPKGSITTTPPTSVIVTTPVPAVVNSAAQTLAPSTGTTQNPSEVTPTPNVAPSPTPTPITITITPLPTPTPKNIGVPEEMKISMKFVNCDTKLVLEALALTMNKRIIMIQETKQKTLSFNTVNTPLLPVIDLILKNENCSSKNLGNTIIIEAIK